MDTNKPQIIKEIFEQELIGKFSDHLSIPGNHRIIFSAPFGAGKTTFLRDFFSEDNQEKLSRRNGVKYKCIHLFPVNYQVGENSDVFEYIKYDIFTRLLLEPNLAIDSERIKFALALPYLLSNNIDKIISPLAHLASVLSIGGFSFKGIGSAYDKFKELKDEVHQQFEELKKSERNKVVEFISEFQSRKGSIYEQDFYTVLISDLVDRLTNNNQDSESLKEETVLVIDDLDRIDPHHTFRLFNIFSAHFDQYPSLVENDDKVYQVNKFGFDKIIFVCDINNVRSIFSHFYGVSASFSGYIDKFYSRTPFSFNPAKAIINHLKRFYTFDVDGDYSSLGARRGSADAKTLSEYFLSSLVHAGFFQVLEEMIKISVEVNKTTLRNLTKLKGARYTIKMGQEIETPSGVTIKNSSALIVLFCKFLHDISGGADELVNLLRRCDDFVEASPSSLSCKEYIFKHCIAYLGYSNASKDTYQLDNFKTVEYTVEFETSSNNHKFVSLREGFYIRSSITPSGILNENKIPLSEVNIFPLIIRVVEGLKSINYFD